MNRFLARMVGVLNRLLAALFPVGGPSGGAAWGAHFGFHVVLDAVIGLFVGMVAGAFLALVVCGLLALLVSIHGTLNDIRRLLAEAAADTSNGARQIPVLFHRGGNDRLSTKSSAGSVDRFAQRVRSGLIAFVAGPERLEPPGGTG